MNNILTPIIYNLQTSINSFDETKGIIKGQQLININTNQYFINIDNSTDLCTWQYITNDLSETQFEIGSGIFLGNETPYVFYHQLNRYPNFINITVSQQDNIGDVYLHSIDEHKFAISNTGNYGSLFCWFII